MPLDSAYYAAGVVLPGPSSAPASAGQIPSWNVNGTFAGWIGSYDGTTLTLPKTIVPTKVGVGAEATVDGFSMLFPAFNGRTDLLVAHRYTDLSTDINMQWNQAELNPTGNTAASAYAFLASNYVKAANDKNIGSVYGAWIESFHQGTGTVSQMYGLESQSIAAAGATVTHNYGIEINSSGGTNNYAISAVSRRTASYGVAGAGSCYGVAIETRNELIVNSGTDATYGYFSNVIRTGATGGTINTYGFYSALTVDNAGSGTHVSYDYYAAARSGTSDADYFLWFASPGVYRVKSDGVMAYYNPSFAAYTPNATNYERVVQQWSSDVLQYGTEAGGTGTLRQLQLIGASIALTASGTNRWNINASGHLLAHADNAYDIGASGATRPRNLYVAGLAVIGGNLSADVTTCTNIVATFHSFASSRGYMQAQSDAVWTFFNNSSNNFGRLQLGGTSSSFPAIKRSSDTLAFVLADDSAPCGISCSTVTLADGANIVVNTSTGTKFGTATGQKMGWWNATPVVQQVLATGAGATVDNVISLLQTLGLCKQS